MPTLITRGSVSARAYGFGGASKLATYDIGYFISGTYTWVAPTGITKVSAIVVSGGGNGGQGYCALCASGGWDADGDPGRAARAPVRRDRDDAH